MATEVFGVKADYYVVRGPIGPHIVRVTGRPVGDSRTFGWWFSDHGKIMGIVGAWPVVSLAIYDIYALDFGVCFFAYLVANGLKSVCLKRMHAPKMVAREYDSMNN